jgi:uncharacterized protein (DUF1499 family)
MSKKPTTFVTAVEVTPEVTPEVTNMAPAPSIVQQDKQYLTARFDKDFLKNTPEVKSEEPEVLKAPRLSNKTLAEMKRGREAIDQG